MRLRIHFIGLLCCALAASAAPLQLVYPPGQNAGDKRYQYYWDLLTMALNANQPQYGKFSLQAADQPMSPARAALEIARGNMVNIMVRTTSADLEKQLLPIRIPLDKGLTGYRMFLIRREQQAQLSQVASLADLAQFSIGQDRQWVDVHILRAAGLQVVEGEGYAGLFRMLQIGRFALFSRGVNEIADELAEQRPHLQELAIEQKLLLYYPLPRYFFVARTAEGERAAQRIEQGLQRLLQSGEFDRRYRNYKKLVLGQLNLKGRRLFRIANPTLSAETPLQNGAWWDDLRTELAGSEGKPGK